MSGPVFHLLAGPNGAGKTTLYRALTASGAIGHDLEFVNADQHERDHLQNISDPQRRSEAAREWSDARRTALLGAKTGFASETVFSHPSKLDLIKKAQQAGFQVVLHVVSVQDPKILPARVKQRVLEGGHDVPDQRVLQRYPRTMINLKSAVRLADLAFIYDAQDVAQGGPRLLALCEKDQTTWLTDKRPAWAESMLAS